MTLVRQLDENDPQVVHHGPNHLPEAGGLSGSLADVDIIDLRYPVHQCSHFFAEALHQIVPAEVRVFQNVVKKRAYDGRRVHFEIDEDFRRAKGMNHEGFSRGAFLTLVEFSRPMNRFEDLPAIGAGVDVQESGETADLDLQLFFGKDEAVVHRTHQSPSLRP